MHPLRLLSAAGQVAAHLRSELEAERWTGKMPGVNSLSAELGVNRKTVEAALRQLERDGILLGQGPGRMRLIIPAGTKAASSLRVAMLTYETSDRFLAYIVELQHALTNAGHSAVFPGKALTDLGMDVARIARLVKQTAADAWVVQSGSREVLEWFLAQPAPVFALFGRREGLPIAATGPDKIPAITAATRQLIALGHRRIVILCRGERRKPGPGRGERAILDELTAHGIPTSDYNLPDWEETPEGFQKLLTSLFKVTPPTALIIEEAPLFVAAQQFLSRSGLRSPEQVSLICSDSDPAFAWCQPAITCIRWDASPIIRRIVRWAADVSRGRKDIRQTSTPAEFIPGGTIGPAPPGG